MGGYAWVTLATNNAYCLGALVLAHSLRKVNTKYDLVALITPAVSDTMRELLQKVYNVIKVVDVLDSKDEAHLALLKRPELGVTFTKINCWKLSEYEKCVFLDADTMVVMNCDELFEREEFSAAPDVSWPDCFNSGVFVYRPSLETFESLLQFATEKGSFDGGDQGLLNQFFSDWATKDINKHLPFIYNLTSVASYSYIPAFKRYASDIRIVHFIGTGKPWLQHLDPATKTVTPASGSEHLQSLLQNWWDLFTENVHPHLSKDLEVSNGMPHPPVEAQTNTVAVECTQPEMPQLHVPCTPCREESDFRQFKLPYTPFNVTNSSGELLNLKFEPWPICVSENRENQNPQSEVIHENEPSNASNQSIGFEKQSGSIFESTVEEEKKENVDEEVEITEDTNEEKNESRKNDFDYETFFPDENCVFNYLQQNVLTYKPFSYHEEDYEVSRTATDSVNNEDNESESDPDKTEKKSITLPRFLAIPESDKRQSGNFERSPNKSEPPPVNELTDFKIPDRREEDKDTQYHPDHDSIDKCHFSDLPKFSESNYQPDCNKQSWQPAGDKSTRHQATEAPFHCCTESFIQELPKAKSMTNLVFDVQSFGSRLPASSSISKSQPNVANCTQRKFSMPKLKPLLPKQRSLSNLTPSSIPKVTQYTEFFMSSDYKDPIGLPKDDTGFISLVKDSLNLKRSKSVTDLRDRSGPGSYASLLKSGSFNRSFFTHPDNEWGLCDLKDCKRQMGNKPPMKDEIPKENSSRSKVQRKKLRRNVKDAPLSDDYKAARLRTYKGRNSLQKTVPSRPVKEVSTANNVEDILRRLTEYSEKYLHYFGRCNSSATNSKIKEAYPTASNLQNPKPDRKTDVGALGVSDDGRCLYDSPRVASLYENFREEASKRSDASQEGVSHLKKDVNYKRNIDGGKKRLVSEPHGRQEVSSGLMESSCLEKKTNKSNWLMSYNKFRIEKKKFQKRLYNQNPRALSSALCMPWRNHAEVNNNREPEGNGTPKSPKTTNGLQTVAGDLIKPDNKYVLGTAELKETKESINEVDTNREETKFEQPKVVEISSNGLHTSGNLSAGERFETDGKFQGEGRLAPGEAEKYLQTVEKEEERDLLINERAKGKESESNGEYRSGRPANPKISVKELSEKGSKIKKEFIKRGKARKPEGPASMSANRGARKGCEGQASKSPGGIGRASNISPEEGTRKVPASSETRSPHEAPGINACENGAAEDSLDSAILEDRIRKTGIAGAVAKLNLGPNTEEQGSEAISLAQDDYIRRQNWESGNIDYMGRDSFDNIWGKICQTIEGKPAEEDTTNKSETTEKMQEISSERSQEEKPQSTNVQPPVGTAPKVSDPNNINDVNKGGVGEIVKTSAEISSSVLPTTVISTTTVTEAATAVQVQPALSTTSTVPTTPKETAPASIPLAATQSLTTTQTIPKSSASMESSVPTDTPASPGAAETFSPTSVPSTQAPQKASETVKSDVTAMPMSKASAKSFDLPMETPPAASGPTSGNSVTVASAGLVTSQTPQTAPECMKLDSLKASETSEKAEAPISVTSQVLQSTIQLSKTSDSSPSDADKVSVTQKSFVLPSAPLPMVSDSTAAAGESVTVASSEPTALPPQTPPKAPSSSAPACVPLVTSSSETVPPILDSSQMPPSPATTQHSALPSTTPQTPPMPSCPAPAEPLSLEMTASHSSSTTSAQSPTPTQTPTLTFPHTATAAAGIAVNLSSETPAVQPVLQIIKTPPTPIERDEITFSEQAALTTKAEEVSEKESKEAGGLPKAADQKDVSDVGGAVVPYCDVFQCVKDCQGGDVQCKKVEHKKNVEEIIKRQGETKPAQFPPIPLPESPTDVARPAPFEEELSKKQEEKQSHKKGRSNSLKNEDRQKKGMMSKILEMVGVPAKGRRESEGDVSKSVFYDRGAIKMEQCDRTQILDVTRAEAENEGAKSEKTETNNAKPLGRDTEDSRDSAQPPANQKDQSKDQMTKTTGAVPAARAEGSEAVEAPPALPPKESTKAAEGKRKSPSPKLTMPQNNESVPEATLTSPTPPVHAEDAEKAKNSNLLSVDDTIPETPPVTGSKTGEEKKSGEGVKSEISEILEKAKSAAESQLAEAPEAVNAMKLIAGESKERAPQEPEKKDGKSQAKGKAHAEGKSGKRGAQKQPSSIPVAVKTDVEELKVTTEEDRKKQKSQAAASSKLSDQILKAIPPPRRKPISESKAEAEGDAEGKTPETEEAVGPVPPPRNKPKTPQQSAPKGKPKK